jgi:phospholipid transport system substrate-binding protein
MRRLLGTLSIAGAAVILFAPPVSAADPGKLIESMVTEISEIARTKMGADRLAAMRQVVQNNFDLPYLGRSALGTYWNRVSEQQRARFLAAVEAAEARAYSERLGRRAGYSVTISNVKSRPNRAWIVDSRLNQTGSQSINIEWEVHEGGQGLRIRDVKVEGISMATVMRADYNSYILSNLGDVEPLVKALEARAVR